MKGSETIRRESAPVLDALAATLRGNPDIAKIEIGGHASGDESERWGLSSRRAAAVRAALVARGVEPKRLILVPYGSTRPLDERGTEPARDKNRRVDFLIAERREDAAPGPTRRAPTKIDTATAHASVHTTTKPAEVAGTVRYELGEPVTIKKGSSSMVSILNKPIGAHDVYLFRPDGNAPASHRHPFRAVRLVNDSGFMLEPGPIAIFAHGSFVGDSMIGRLALGETAWVPYALDGATTVTAATDEDERPIRIMSIQRGVMTVENAGVRITKYSITTGRDPAKQIYIRHAKASGYAAEDLPPGTQDRGDSYLVPLPLQAQKTSVLTIEERQPRRSTLQLLDAGATEIGLYVEGSHLTPDIVERMTAATALRKEMGTLEESIEAHRERLTDLAARAGELRENLKSLDKVRGADGVNRKLVSSLSQLTTDADAVARKLGLDSEALATARNKLQDSLRNLTLDAGH